MSLFPDHAPDRSVGPLFGSVQTGTNAALIATIAPTYLTGSVLDTTYGRGKWWERFTPDPFTFHDLAIDGVDFRDLPHDDRSFDAVCFDPPYLPQGGVTSPAQRDQDFRNRFGLTEPRSGDELRQMLTAGMTECARVTDRWLLVKCNDYTNSRALHLGHYTMLRHAEQLDLVCHDLIVHHTGSGPGGSQIKEQVRARRHHSYLLVFRRAGR
jgi:hypothetical protein